MQMFSPVLLPTSHDILRQLTAQSNKTVRSNGRTEVASAEISGFHKEALLRRKRERFHAIWSITWARYRLSCSPSFIHHPSYCSVYRNEPLDSIEYRRKPGIPRDARPHRMKSDPDLSEEPIPSR